jgi:hypothetical protein
VTAATGTATTTPTGGVLASTAAVDERRLPL